MRRISFLSFAFTGLLVTAATTAQTHEQPEWNGKKWAKTRDFFLHTELDESLENPMQDAPTTNATSHWT